MKFLIINGILLFSFMSHNIYGWSDLIMAQKQGQSNGTEAQLLSNFHSNFSSDILNETIHNFTLVNFSEHFSTIIMQKSSESNINKLVDIRTGRPSEMLLLRPTNELETQPSKVPSYQPVSITSITPTHLLTYPPSVSPSNVFMSIVSLPQFEISLIFPSSISEEILASSSPIFKSTITVLEQRTSIYLSDTLDTLLVKSKYAESSSSDYYSFKSIEIFISEPSSRNLEQKNIYLAHYISNGFDEDEKQLHDNHRISRKTETKTISRKFIFNGHLIFDERVVPNDNEILNALSSVLRDDGGSGLDGMRYFHFIKYSFNDVLAKAIGVSVSVDGMDSFTALTEEKNINQQTTFQDTKPSSQSSGYVIKSVIIVSCVVIFIALLSCLATCFSKRNEPRTKKVQKRNQQSNANTSVFVYICSCWKLCTASNKEDDGSSSEENGIDDDSFFRELERARADELENEKSEEMEENFIFGRGKHVSFHNKLAIIADDKNDSKIEELVWVDHNGEMRKLNQASRNVTTSRSYIESHERGNLLYDDANETFVPISPSISTKSPKRNHELSSFQTQNPSSLSTVPKLDEEPSLSQPQKPSVCAKFPKKDSASSSNHQAQEKSSTNPFQKFVHKQSNEDFKKSFSIESDSTHFFDDDDQNVFKSEKQKQPHVWKELSNDDPFFQPVSISNHTTKTKDKIESNASSTSPTDDITSSTDKAHGNTTVSTKDLTHDSTLSNNELKVVSDVLKELRKVSKFLNKRLSPRYSSGLPLSDSTTAVSETSYEMKSTIKTISTTSEMKKKLPPKIYPQKKSNGMHSKARLPKNIEIVPNTEIQPSVISSLDGGSLTVGTLTNSAPMGTIDVKVQSDESTQNNDKIEGKIITAKSDHQKSSVTGYAPLVTQEDSSVSADNLESIARSSSSDYSETASNGSSSKESFDARGNFHNNEKFYSRNGNPNLPQNADETPLLGMKQPNKSSVNSDEEYANKRENYDCNHDSRLQKDYEIKPKTSFTEKFLQQEVDAFFDETGSNTTGNSNKIKNFTKPYQIAKRRNPESQFANVSDKEQNDSTSIEETSSFKPYSMRSVTSDISTAFTINSTGEVVDKTKKRQIRRLHEEVEEESYISDEDDIIVKNPVIKQSQQNAKLGHKYLEEDKRLIHIKSSGLNSADGSASGDTSSSEFEGNEYLKPKELIPMFERIHPGPARPPLHPHSDSWDNSVKTPRSSAIGSEPMSKESPTHSASTSSFRGLLGARPLKSTTEFTDLEVDSSVMDSLESEHLSQVTEKRDKSVEFSTMSSKSSSLPEGFFEKEVESLFTDRRPLYRNRTMKPNNLASLKKSQHVQFSQPPSFHQHDDFYPHQTKETIDKTSLDRTARNKRVIQRAPNQVFENSDNENLQPAVNVNFSSSAENDSGVISGGEFPTNPIRTNTAKGKTNPENTQHAKNEKTMIISNKSKKYATAAVKMIDKLANTKTNEDIDQIGITSDLSALRKEEQLKASVLISMFEKKKW